jgi:hypothetical protein
MSLSDDLIKQKKALDAAGANAKAKEQEWNQAVNALLKHIEDILSPAREAKAVSFSRVPPMSGMQVSPHALTITPPSSPAFTLQPVIIQATRISRVEIQGGAIVGSSMVLTWDGSGRELENWSIPLPTAGPRAGRTGTRLGGNQPHGSGPASEALTTRTLEAVLGRYLGLGAGGSS